MTAQTMPHRLVNHLPFTPNKEQETALDQLQEFLEPACREQFFILKGAAGTGKTSLIKAVTDWLVEQKQDFCLSAPTGRAAQIIGKKTGQPAGTTHSLVYIPEPDEDGIVVRLVPRPNLDRRPCIYIVDEASLVSDTPGNSAEFISSKPLLSRMIEYAKEGNTNNKFLFIGDEYQLPPVGAGFSPALSEAYLEKKFGMKGRGFALNQVMRQQDGSYILQNARALRQSIRENLPPCKLQFQHSGSYGGALRSYVRNYKQHNDGRVLMIGRSNRQVLAMNQSVRNVLFHWNVQQHILPGEMLVANQNTILADQVLFRGNCLWVEKTGPMETFAGVHFLNTTTSFQSLAGEWVRARTKIVLDSLVNENGSLSIDQRKAIVHEALKRNRKYRESRRPEDDAFVGALHARYGYALTCHKAQGGEWQHVYLNPMYGQAESRWLYTAVTRAAEHLYSW